MAWYDYLNPFSQVARQSVLQDLSKLRIGLSQPGGYLPKVLTPYKDYVPGLNVTPFGWREASAKTPPEENASGQMTPWSPGYDPSADPGGGGESGSGGTYTAPSGGTYPYSETFLGRTYSNPEEALTAKLAYLTDLYGSKLGEQRRAFKQSTGYEDPNKVSYGNVGGTLGEQKTNFLQSIADNIARIQSYYGGLGDIYQSSQGVRLNKQEGKRKQGETGLQRTLSNYLDQYNTGQKDLATQFLQAKDTLANANEDSLQKALSAGNLNYAAADIPDTGMAPLTTAQGMAQSYRQAGNMFNEGPSATGGKVDVPSILDWLYRQTATK